MGYRILTVGNNEYSYVVGNNFLKIKTPDNGSHVVKMSTFLGMSPAEWVELSGDRCDCCHGRSASPRLAVTPSKIVAYIKENKL